MSNTNGSTALASEMRAQIDASLNSPDGSKISPFGRIEARSLTHDHMTLKEEQLDEATAYDWAKADLTDFNRASPEDQEFAAEQMMISAERNETYAEALRAYDPEAAEKIEAMHRRQQEIISAKEFRKDAEFDAMSEETENSIEAGFEREAKPLDAANEAARSAWLSAGANDTQDKAQQQGDGYSQNQVESDEVFTASQPDIRPLVPAEVEKKYVRVGDTFYNSKNTDLVAFEDRGNKLVTKANSEHIAEDMVRVAESRGWDEIKVRGTESFRYQVWHEAAMRGMHVRGYTPTEAQEAQVEAERKAKGIEDKPDNPTGDNKADQDKAREKPTAASMYAGASQEEALNQHPELAHAYAVETAIDKKAEADGLTKQQRAIVGARVRANIAATVEQGKMPEVKVKEEIRQEREATTDKELSR